MANLSVRTLESKFNSKWIPLLVHFGPIQPLPSTSSFVVAGMNLGNSILSGSNRSAKHCDVSPNHAILPWFFKILGPKSSKIIQLPNNLEGLLLADIFHVLEAFCNDPKSATA